MLIYGQLRLLFNLIQIGIIHSLDVIQPSFVH